MTSFETTQSFEVPVTKQRLGGRKVDKARLGNFWETVGAHALQRGCYVFSLKAGKGEKPWYVGKASQQSLRAECFSLHKLGVYNDILGNRHGIPRLTFVIPKRAKGKWPMLAIDEVEEYLISYAASRNTNLANKRKLPNQKWRIQGVVAGGKGAPTSEALSFKRLMGI
jgi:hypothetical protein